jgi:hypothetical protein
MSKFMEIVAIQPPIDIGVDPNNRATFSTNYRAAASLYSGKIELEIISHLQSVGLAVLGASAVYGSKAVVPSGAGPVLLIKLTGGFTPDFTHDNNRLTNITFQITVWSISHDVALLRSVQIHDELNGKRDLEINL